MGRALCKDRYDTEFVFVDSIIPFVPEFAALVQSCKRLRWVAVNNINLDEMAGWITRYLRNITGWHVVASGSYRWSSDVTLSRGVVPRTRRWELLARGDALLTPPPALAPWLQSVTSASRPVKARRSFAVPALA